MFWTFLPKGTANLDIALRVKRVKILIPLLTGFTHNDQSNVTLGVINECV
jgi:hypothetical protein